MRIRKFITYVIAIFLGVAFTWMVVMKIVSRLAARAGKSSPCPVSLSWLLDNPYRRRSVGVILDRVNIQPGEAVLELGPGPGVFTVQAAQRTGASGRLIAVDIQPKMIAQVEARVRQAGVSNVETHIASAYQLPIPDASVDRAFLVTVLMEIPDPNRALLEIRRVLKPGGLLSITEAFMDPDYPFAFETIRRVERMGYQLVHRFGGFWEYTLNFIKAPEVDEGLPQFSRTL